MTDFDDTDVFWNQKELEEQEMWEQHRKGVEYHKETLRRMKTGERDGYDTVQSE